ncbi:MAG TPA: glutamine-hydrolyzing carbamoyl-phosphate synthase small subunit, partial [Candidatus Binatia bacterium]
MKAVLALADGRTFVGRSFGSQGEAAGEVVFNTSMTGYQEILTDPSYQGQMVAMTYPEIGNVGVNPEDVESRKPFVGGFIVKEYCPAPSNWRCTRTLHAYMSEHGIVGIEGIDTRSLVRHLRVQGSQVAVLSTLDRSPDEMVARAKVSPGLVGKDLVREVTCREPYDWEEGTWILGKGYGSRRGAADFFVVAYDYGIKNNILRNLVERGFRVRVVPASTPAEKVLEWNPDGIFLSNGPGDPDAVPYAKEIVQKLIGKKPIFGICLGHQILGLALGGK